MHFFKCLLKVQKVINKTVKKLTFNFFSGSILCTVSMSIVRFQHNIKKYNNVFFFFIVKNEKRMDVKVHGPMPYTGTEFFFFLLIYLFY